MEPKYQVSLQNHLKKQITSLLGCNVKFHSFSWSLSLSNNNNNNIYYYLLTFLKLSCDFAGDGGTLPGARPLRPPGEQI